MKWIKCSERMPNQFVTVMALCTDGWMYDCYLSDIGFIRWSNLSNCRMRTIIGNVTHWAPMPQPPEE
ncbi:TPA: DUF551 domain-containing protein [Morganella morganii]|nr:DUF551 domain-containing protein [Morganella morganii]